MVNSSFFLDKSILYIYFIIILVVASNFLQQEVAQDNFRTNQS